VQWLQTVQANPSAAPVHPPDPAYVPYFMGLSISSACPEFLPDLRAALNQAFPGISP